MTKRIKKYVIKSGRDLHNANSAAFYEAIRIIGGVEYPHGNEKQRFKHGFKKIKRKVYARVRVSSSEIRCLIQAKVLFWDAEPDSRVQVYKISSNYRIILDVIITLLMESLSPNNRVKLRSFIRDVNEDSVLCLINNFYSKVERMTCDHSDTIREHYRLENRKLVDIGTKYSVVERNNVFNLASINE